MNMKIGGTQAFKFSRKMLALSIIALAALLAILAMNFEGNHPSTDDASIDADIVHVAAAVGGRTIEIGVSENARVRKGDLLFQIDPRPYQAQPQPFSTLLTSTSSWTTR